MKFHTPSFLLGFGSAVLMMVIGRRIRPAVVELAALGLHLSRMGRGIALQQVEHLEDLWAEIDERAFQRIRGRVAEPEEQAGQGRAKA